jgi:hypothetical protein
MPVIPGKIADAAMDLPPSFMRLAHQAEFLAYRSRRISDFLDRTLQLILADAEMPRPVMYLVRLPHRDMAAVALALVEEIVTHLSNLKNAKDPARNRKARPWSAPQVLRRQKKFVSRWL